MNAVADRLLPFAGWDDAVERAEATRRTEAFLAERKAELIHTFAKGDLFGERGAFKELPRDEQRELLGAVLTLLEEETRSFIQREEEGIDWSDANLEPRLQHLLAAAENGVFLPDWKERIASIESATHSYHWGFSAQAIRWRVEEVEETASKIEQLLGEVQEGDYWERT